MPSKYQDFVKSQKGKVKGKNFMKECAVMWKKQNPNMDAEPKGAFKGAPEKHKVAHNKY